LQRRNDGAATTGAIGAIILTQRSLSVRRSQRLPFRILSPTMEEGMARRERLTVEVDPQLRKSLARWAREEGRPVGNLLRRIVTTATVGYATIRARRRQSW
jgi:hypothetical protein